MLIRVVERQTGQTRRTLSRELNRLHLVTLQGPAGSVTQTTTPTDVQHAIYTACETAPPPPITALSPPDPPRPAGTVPVGTRTRTTQPVNLLHTGHFSSIPSPPTAELRFRPAEIWLYKTASEMGPPGFEPGHNGL